LDAFLEYWWDLDQVVAWATTRWPKAVRFACPFNATLQTTLSIDKLRFRLAQVRGRLKGRDVNLELWNASGWTRRFGFVLPTQPRGYDPEKDPPPQGPRVPVLLPFPIVEYLVSLARKGELVLIGSRREGEPPSEIRLEEWATLTICVDPGNWRLGVFLNNAPRSRVKAKGQRYYLPAVFEVRIQRADALRIFPADAPAATGAADFPSVEEIENVIRAAEANGGYAPSQNDAFDIVRAKYAKVRRKDVRAAHKHLYPEMKSGRRRARTKGAE
jgi:hypothetical protein